MQLLDVPDKDKGIYHGSTFKTELRVGITSLCRNRTKWGYFYADLSLYT